MTTAVLINFGLIILFIVGSVALNIPIAIAIGISSVLLVMINSTVDMSLFVQTLFSSSDSFPLLAIPFFILAGEIMSTGGMARRLVNFVERMVGGFTGGLGIITIVASFIFAAISGSGPATVASIGAMMIPYMIEKGYSPSYASSITAGSGSLGPIVPPSIIFIVYGVMAGVSIGDLFIAGIVPGMLAAIALLIVNFFISKKEGYKGYRIPGNQKVSFWKALNEAKYALLAPVLILGGIYGGIVTPTEASVVGVVYSIIITVFVYKEVKIKDVSNIFMKAASTSGAIMIFVGMASFFGKFLTLEQIPQILATTIQGMTSNPIIILIIINIFLLIVGMFIETVAAILIFVPLLLPIVLPLGIDPVHFGLIVCFNLTIGMLSPPFGINVFIASGIANIPFERTFKHLIPILLALLAVLALITLIPELTLFLPSILK